MFTCTVTWSHRLLLHIHGLVHHVLMWVFMQRNRKRTLEVDAPAWSREVWAAIQIHVPEIWGEASTKCCFIASPDEDVRGENNNIGTGRLWRVIQLSITFSHTQHRLGRIHAGRFPEIQFDWHEKEAKQYGNDSPRLIHTCDFLIDHCPQESSQRSSEKVSGCEMELIYPCIIKSYIHTTNQNGQFRFSTLFWWGCLHDLLNTARIRQ